jgi:hypothetical protein
MRQPHLVTFLGYVCLIVGIVVLFWAIVHQALHLM